MGYYKIKKIENGCKISFMDIRMNKFINPIVEVFKAMDAVDGSYVPKSSDYITGKYQKAIKLVENIRRKTDDCFHKAVAVRYSLSVIKQEMSNRPSADDMKNYSEMIANNMCEQAELKNDGLIYETEAFLFQVRTNLDILIQLLKYVPEYRYLEDVSRSGDTEAFVFCNKKLDENTTNKMRANGHELIADFFDVETNEWIRELNKMRNEVAHRSGLKGFTSFVFNSGKDKVIYAQMPNGKNADDFCEEIFSRLMCLYKNVFEKFILPKFVDKNNLPML